MTHLAHALHLAVVTLERRGHLPTNLPHEFAVAVALETAVTTARGNAARDLAETAEVASQVDAIAKRDFGVATTETRARVIKRLLASTSEAPS